jgi:hypothetical protein
MPSSLPYVRVDPALQGAVISREGAIVVATKRSQDRARCAMELADCDARATRAERGEAQQAKLAQSNASWRIWGPLGILAAAVIAFGGGIAVGFAVTK